MQARFASSHGTDPIFTNNDGSNCEGAVPQTLAGKRAAYSLLLTRGLIRVALDVPPTAEFVIERIDDPNHCGPATNDASLYRRPLPSTNLRFLSGVMWDGRESSATTTIEQDLLHQANSATRGHAQGAVDLTPLQAQQIVRFETGLFTAQAVDREAGSLPRRGGARRPRRAVLAAVLHRHQRPGRPESDRRAVRSRRRSRCSTPGRVSPAGGMTTTTTTAMAIATTTTTATPRRAARQSRAGRRCSTPSRSR